MAPRPSLAGPAELRVERRRDLKAAYPALFATGWPAVEAACSQYLDLHPRHDDAASASDILQFGVFLLETLCDAESVPAYTGELVRFVHVLQGVRFAPDNGWGVRVSATRPVTLRDRPARAAEVVLERFSCNITEIEEALRCGREPDPRAQEERVVYGRGRDDGEAVILRVSEATALLVERCDGSQTLGAVIAGAAPACLRPVMAPAAMRAVDRLIGAGIFELYEPEMLSAAAAREPR